MVQAILKGNKTQTRRVIKNQSDANCMIAGHNWEVSNLFKKCPYGQPGNLLYVREKWQLVGWNFEDGDMTIRYEAGGQSICDEHIVGDYSSWMLSQLEQLEDKGIIIQDPENEEKFIFTGKEQPFKPSIHMPKAAARIWLQVVSVRVERLNDITEDDAKAEGVEKAYEVYKENARYRLGFMRIWEKLNGKESLNANPWVWAVTFKVLSTTGKPLQ